MFNVKGVDDRHSTEKKRFPAVLDIGFCEARLPDLMPDYGTAKHVMNAQNALLGRQEPRRVGANITPLLSISLLIKLVQAL